MLKNLSQKFVIDRTCPHCQHSFKNFKQCKGILFCPQCNQSVRKNYFATRKTYAKLLSNPNRLLLSIGASLVFYFFIKFEIINLSAPFVFNLFIFLNLGIISYKILNQTLKGYLFDDLPLQKGIDTFEQVQKDIGEYGLSILSGKPVTPACPKCHSQRMSNFEWFLANSPDMEVPHVNKYRFMGCLNCHVMYEYEAISPPKQWFFAIIFVFACIGVLIFLPIYLQKIFNLDSEVGLSIKVMLVFFWAYFLVFSSSKGGNQINDNNSKLKAINAIH